MLFGSPSLIFLFFLKLSLQTLSRKVTLYKFLVQLAVSEAEEMEKKLFPEIHSAKDQLLDFSALWFIHNTRFMENLAQSAFPGCCLPHQIENEMCPEEISPHWQLSAWWDSCMNSQVSLLRCFHLLWTYIHDRWTSRHTGLSLMSPWSVGLTPQTGNWWNISESMSQPCILLALLHFGKICIK